MEHNPGYPLKQCPFTGPGPGLRYPGQCVQAFGIRGAVTEWSVLSRTAGGKNHYARPSIWYMIHTGTRRAHADAPGDRELHLMPIDDAAAPMRECA